MLYIITFVIFAILSYREIFMEKTQESRSIDKILTFFCAIYLLILTSIRGGEVGDYITYKEIFSRIDTSNFSTSTFAFEPLYSILQWVCKAVIDNFQVFLFVIGAIVILLEIKFAKSMYVSEQGLVIAGGGRGYNGRYNKIKQTYFFTIIFIFWGLYQANIFVIRSTIAVIICLFSTKFITARKIWKFLLCVLIATGFHYSALCFIPAYWIYHIRSKLSTKLIIVMVVSLFLLVLMKDILILIGQLLGGRIRTKINSYLAGGFTIGVGENIASKGIILFLKAIVNIGFLIVVGSILWKDNKRNKSYEGIFNLYLFGCILYIATLSFSYAFARVSLYYNIFQVPLLLFSFEGRKKNEKQFIWLGIVLYIFARMIVNLATNQTFDFITF